LDERKSSPSRLTFVVGPTGVGKNDLALEAAVKTEGSLLNADSVQLYSEVRIGANAPSPKDLARCPHHLFGVVPLGQEITAGDYWRRASEFLREAPPGPIFVVGGSGFYIQALQRGLFEIEKPSPKTQSEMAQLKKRFTPHELHQRLTEVDPAAAGRIHPNDEYRTTRALEIWLESGRSRADLWQEKAAQATPDYLSGFTVKKIGLWLPRDEHRVRLRVRVKQMLAAGLLEETATLLKKSRQQKLDPNAPDWWPLRSIGYKECAAFLDGQMAEVDLVPAIAAATANLAKRQLTWFRRDPEIQWFRSDTEWDHAVGVATTP
jgi:tRNA dimethylallyltransferase